MQNSLPVLTFLLASACVLQEFLSGFSRLLVSQLNPEIPEQRVQAAVNELLGSVGANTPKPVNVRLEFKHVCKCVSLQQQQKQQQQLSVQWRQGSAGTDAGRHFAGHVEPAAADSSDSTLCSATASTCATSVTQAAPVCVHAAAAMQTAEC
jgi:hypothetical protein